MDGDDDDDLKALALFLDSEIQDDPQAVTAPETFDKIVSIKDNATSSSSKPTIKSEDASGKTFSDFFKSMKPKVVDLNETIVKTKPKKNVTPKKPTFGFDPAADPVFGLRMINPLLSSQTIQDRMIGKIPVPISQVQRHLQSGDNNCDWVVAGVLVNKSLPKTSQKGTSYSIWKICDLKPRMNNITIFLFGRSHAELWKTSVGSVIGILNPKELDGRDKKDELTLCIHSGDQVMMWGTSKDYGTCKGVKKNGDKCDMYVNKTECNVCTFHIKKEYIKHCSQRANIGNSRPTAARSLRDKVLGKNEVFYGGQSFVSTKANHSVLMKEDQVKLQRLNPTNEKLKPIEKPSTSHNTVASRRATAIKDFVSSMKASEMTGCGRKNIEHKDAPQMCTFKDILGNSSNLNNFGSQRSKCAKTNALNWIKSNGPIKKESPNLFEKSKDISNKRKLPECVLIDLGQEKKVAKKEKVSSRFLELMKATSQNQDLVDAAQQEAEDKYFDEMDKKEKLEQKMMNTYKIPCKAVRCIVCKYTWFSASEWCKKEKHTLRVQDATKRFFKCTDCSSRIACLTMFPMISCKNCNGSKWERAPMMSHKKVDEPNLSIRGDEQAFLGAMQPKLSMGLMVVEND